MALYLDEDVSVLVAELLRARGFDALTTLDARRTGASDAEQLEFASGQRRVLLTHNRRDFEALAVRYGADGREHAGIILAVRRTPYDLVGRLLPLLNQTTADEMWQQTRYI